MVLFGKENSVFRENKVRPYNLFHQHPSSLLVLKKGPQTTPQTPRQSLSRGLTAPPVAHSLRYARGIKAPAWSIKTHGEPEREKGDGSPEGECPLRERLRFGGFTRAGAGAGGGGLLLEEEVDSELGILYCHDFNE